MPYPAQLRSQIESADQLVKQPEQVDAQPEQLETPAEQPEQPEQPEQDESASDALTVIKQELERSEQRYRTLQGMHRTLTDEVQQMRALMSQMNQQSQQSQQAAVDADEAKDREDFGTDFYDFVQRVVTRMVGNLPSRLQRVEATSQESAREKFERKLTERVSNWRQLEQAAGWVEFLQAKAQRVARLNSALAEYDYETVADLFELFAASQPSLPVNEAPAQPRPGPAPSPKRGAQRQQSSDQPPEQRIWTRTEIAQVYEQSRSLPPDEFAKAQQDIFAAQREGRVDYSR